MGLNSSRLGIKSGGGAGCEAADEGEGQTCSEGRRSAVEGREGEEKVAASVPEGEQDEEVRGRSLDWWKEEEDEVVVDPSAAPSGV